jgi:outer membrane protein assembly factor BamB
VNLKTTALKICLLFCIAAPAAGAEKLIDTSDIAGGVCAMLGRSDSDLALSVAKRKSFVVHALYANAKTARAATAAFRAGGLHGRVSADVSTGSRLPYAPNIVNVLAADNYAALKARGLSLEEIARVLAPLGTVFLGGGDELIEELKSAGFDRVRKDGKWIRGIKPWPAEIDQWTHYCHGPDSNPVARDKLVGPPKHYQWTAGPRWSRSHDSDSSVNSLVSAGGRIFYMVDEGPISLPGQHSLPDKWFVVARDAFNGVLLWKKPVEQWGWRQWKDTWFKCRPGVFPISLNRRLVAVGDDVYVTLGYRAPVSRLNAKTGEVCQVYAGTERTNEIIRTKDRLILSMNRDAGVKIMCLAAATGKVIWQSAPKYKGTTKDYIKFKAMRGVVKPTKLDPGVNLSVDGEIICLLDGRDAVCLDIRNGAEKWRSEVADEKGDAWMGSLIVHKDAVICATARTLYSLSRKTGKKLWTKNKKPLGHLWYEWKDVFVIGDLVWTYGPENKRQTGKFRSFWPAAMKGYDPKTGKVTKTIPLGNIFTAHHHHRCYRNKATDRYILTSRRGTEFVSLTGGRHTVHNWLRGICHMGMMPANGLQYTPPHPCRCYINENLSGFNAIASASASAPQPVEPETPLEKGPAYARIASRKPILASASDWPTYRGDPIRSGAATCKLPDKLRSLWSVRPGGKLSAPVIAAGKVFVAAVDEYHVLALDAKDGSKLWEAPAGGRVDSPPTYYRGSVLFGCTDGYVYCLRAGDGELRWRFRAAPEARLIGAYSRLESAWPVNGGVLVHKGVAYFAAGRSSYLDGGIYVYALNPTTGALLHRAKLSGPETDFSNTKAHFTYGKGPGTKCDIMQADENGVYLRDKAFDLALKPLAPARIENRVRPLGGFLDDTYFRRAMWYYGTMANYGQLIVHNADRTYIVRMFHNRKLLDPKNFFTPGKDGYRIIAGLDGWQKDIPVRVRAMVAAGPQLILAGPPDVVGGKDPLGAFEGRKGGIIQTLATEDGKQIAEYKLDSPPIFNGIAAANGRLYLVTVDGKIRCFGK